MKFTSIVSLAFATFALAAPVDKRAASLEEVATTGYATMNGGTTGGKGGKTIEVSTYDALKSAVSGDSAAIVLITGAIKGTESLKVGSNKSVIGKNSKASLSGFGLLVKDTKNVIFRNFAVSKVVGGDAIAVNKGTNVWIDHLDLSSDMNNGKDYYDGLLDLTHAADYITVSNVYMHDHYKCSLVGHSDSNGSEDKGHLRITYHNNYWKNINSRGPSFRFGTGHLYNNYYENVSDGINTRQGAQLLVENNVFSGSKKALYATDAGYAVESGNDFGGATNNAPKGTLTKAPYSSSPIAASGVKAAVVGTAGVTLSF